MSHARWIVAYTRTVGTLAAPLRVVACAVALGAFGACAPETILGSYTTESPSTRRATVPNAKSATSRQWVEVRGGPMNTACARDTRGSVRCWTLGGTSTADRRLAPIEGASSLGVGGGSNYAVLDNGDVVAWGPWLVAPAKGMPRPAESADEAVTIPALKTAVEIVGHAYGSCARFGNGTVRCHVWRLAPFFASNSAPSRDATIEVANHPSSPGLTDAMELAVGNKHACALRTNGTVACWGKDDVGQLGDGAGRSSDGALSVKGLTDVVEIDARGDSTCALRNDGTVWCWGRAGAEAAVHEVPERVPEMTDAAEIAVGEAHLCVRRTGGTVVCIGANTHGELGTGPGTDRGRRTIDGLDDAVKLTATRWGACAIRESDGIVCWGEGHGVAPIPPLDEPTRVATPTP